MRATLFSALLLAAGDRLPDPQPTKPDRVLIPAGAFVKGSNRGADDERPVTKRTLRAYKIDRTEVTRAMYARCVASHRCSRLAIDLTQDPRLPVTNVDWNDARAY
jgi:sulfatase modifying factor 1